MNNNNVGLNSIFSNSTFTSILREKNNNILDKYLESHLENKEIDTNNDIIKELYRYLQLNYRNEYFFKNTLFNKVILGRHSLNTTTALTEVPVHKSKADFIKINGSAVVYEIKTDLDSFERLEQQIIDYYKAFTRVNIVISQANEKKAKKILDNTNVGIIVLTKRNQFSERKKALEENSYLDMKTMFNILRKYEFEEIIQTYYGFLPNTRPVFYYNECFYLFKEIPLKTAHDLFTAELKKRNQLDIKEYLKTIPYELRFLAYFSNEIQNNYKTLVNFLNEERG